MWSLLLIIFAINILQNEYRSADFSSKRMLKANGSFRRTKCRGIVRSRGTRDRDVSTRTGGRSRDRCRDQRTISAKAGFARRANRLRLDSRWLDKSQRRENVSLVSAKTRGREIFRRSPRDPWLSFDASRHRILRLVNHRLIRYLVKFEFGIISLNNELL